MDITTKNEKLLGRHLAWQMAGGMVQLVVDQHPLVAQKRGAVAFSTGDTVSPAEQHIDQIIRVADWLMETS